MKRIKYFIFPLLICLFMAGCEDSTKITVASFSEITAAGSQNFGMRVSFQEDKRVEEKYYDIQIMTDTDDVSLVFWKEGESKLSTFISEKNRWHSLTSLKVSAAGLEGSESFSTLKDAVDESYLFNVSQKVKLIFRVVAGEVVESANLSGQVLTDNEPVSEDFVLKCEPKT